MLQVNNSRPVFEARTSYNANVEYSMVGECGLGRREKRSPYGGGWSRGKEHSIGPSYSGSENAETPPVLSHSIASIRFASTTSTQSMTRRRCPLPPLVP
ncbi:unnamed protein product [Lasius platythorax]|uniref:Uncharacterized protein n=1 Tax=Lasius platythorax TaxID=488582 RepID=A0AAV2NLU4_9HYME